MPLLSYSGYRFPPDIIQRAVWMYLRFTLSFRDVEELLAERGIVITYESIRRWVLTFGPAIARRLRARRPRPHGRWHLDERVTDKCPAYGAALRTLKLTRAAHTRRKRANYRAESSHVPVRRRERKLQGFKSPRAAQRFLSLHTAIYNVFTVPRHLVSARTHRLFRAEAFEAWRNAASVAA